MIVRIGYISYPVMMMVTFVLLLVLDDWLYGDQLEGWCHILDVHDENDGNDLHPSTGEDDEDDGGVAEDGGERDRAVEQGDHYHLAQLVKMWL